MHPFRYFTKLSTFNRTMRELSALSDRELRDIGLCRNDIRRVASEQSRNI